jgi:hypothetical protein
MEEGAGVERVFGPLTEQEQLRAEIDKAVAESIDTAAWHREIGFNPGGTLTKKAFDSYMVLEEDLEVGQHRLLEVDNKLVLPS